ncbi:recombinase family protein [Thermophilibacter sp.]
MGDISVGRVYGYARVSSADQNLARQIDALLAFGVDQRLIFSDKASGKDFCRPSYRRLTRRLRPGDTVVVKSIDRLGRSYDDIIEEWRRITKERRVHIVVLDMPLLDTREERGGLTGEFIADVVLQLLSYVAQVERDNIRQRQAEGIAAARARGVRFGRPTIERPGNFEQVRQAYQARELTGVQAASACQVSRSTFMRWLSEA